jgi:hypothetical protein
MRWVQGELGSLAFHQLDVVLHKEYLDQENVSH